MSNSENNIEGYGDHGLATGETSSDAINATGSIVKTKAVHYSAQAKISGNKEGQITSSNPQFDMKLSLPKELNGEGGDGTNPEQLFAAAYGACFFESLKHEATKRQVTLAEDITIYSCVELESEGDEFTISIELKIQLSGIKEDIGQSLINEALLVWPYRNIEQAGIKIVASLT